MGARLGFQELLDVGEIENLPRIFGVQSSNCAPLYEAFINNRKLPVAIEKKETIAEGISSSEPVKGDVVLDDIRVSGGAILKAEEKDIWRSFLKLCSLGFYIEPTSAIVGPALEQLYASGYISSEETTVALLTGSGLKATDKIIHYMDEFSSL
jgi:threonine synthase